MAHYMGNLIGQRGEASRLGSKASGITATARSWSGSITVSLYNNGEDRARIEFGEGSRVGGRELWDGPLSDLAGPVRLRLEQPDAEPTPQRFYGRRVDDPSA